jgi:pilus assembly protein CpaB
MGRRTLLLIASILVAALGTALIWLYVQGADTRAEASTTSVQIPVAAELVQPGVPAKNVRTTMKAYPQALVDSLGPGVIRNASTITGYTQTKILPGLPLMNDQFGKQPVAPTPAVQLSPDKLALQVTLPDPQRLAGLLQSGSLVRIFATVQKSQCTKVLLDRVKVLASGSVVAPDTGAKTDVPQAIVTLELDNRDALTIVNSQTQDSGGKNLWFGLLGAKTPDASEQVCPARTDG